MRYPDLPGLSPCSRSKLRGSNPSRIWSPGTPSPATGMAIPRQCFSASSGAEALRAVSADGTWSEVQAPESLRLESLRLQRLHGLRQP